MTCAAAWPLPSLTLHWPCAAQHSTIICMLQAAERPNSAQYGRGEAQTKAPMLSKSAPPWHAWACSASPAAEMPVPTCLNGQDRVELADERY